MPELLVIKQNPQEQETWRYPGRLLRERAGAALVEANFNRPDRLFNGMLLEEGDIFIEAYYSARWYNIFEIRSHRDQTLKGWYCNVTRPARITPRQITYVDLALDLLVFPDGRKLVLDEDEFAALHLDAQEAAHAFASLAELQTLFEQPSTFDLARFFESDDEGDTHQQ